MMYQVDFEKNNLCRVFLNERLVGYTRNPKFMYRKLKLLKHISVNHNKIKPKTDYYEDIYKKRKSLFNYFGEIENKEIVVIIMLGIFIIILLDFMMKGIKNKI